MKKCNKTILKTTLLTLLIGFLCPLVVLAADDEYVYTVVNADKGNAIGNLQTYSLHYRETDVEVKYFSDESECKDNKGKWDTSKAYYKTYKTYKFTCEAKSSVGCNPNRFSVPTKTTKEYVQTETRFIYKKEYNYTRDAIEAIKSSCKLKSTNFTCYSIANSSIKDRETVNFQYKSGPETVECPFKSYEDAKNAAGYVPAGNYSDCYKVGPEYHKCTITKTEAKYENGVLSTAYSNVIDSEGNSAEAWCVNPGKGFPSVNTRYKKATDIFQISDCNKVNTENKFACGVAAIFIKRKEMIDSGTSVDTAATITALRLWASQNNYGDGNLASIKSELSTSNEIYKTTGNKIINGGYEGEISNASKNPGEDVIAAVNATGLTQLQNAITLFKSAVNFQGITAWTAELSEPGNKTASKKGDFSFTINTNFDEQTTDISIKSLTSGIEFKKVEETECKQPYKKCYKISANIKDIESLESNSRVSYSVEVAYKDPRDLTAFISLLTPSDGSKQRFITFDTNGANKSITVHKSGTVMIPDKTVCEEDELTVNNIGGPIECSDSNAGVVADPRLTCILNEYVWGHTSVTDGYDYTSKYLPTNNKYCTVMCRETIAFNMFDAPTVGAISGQNQSSSSRYLKFDRGIDSGMPSVLSYITGDRQCAVIIDYDAWEKEYERLNKLVWSTWDEYKMYENLDDPNLTTKTKVQYPCDASAETCTDCCTPCWSCNCTTYESCTTSGEGEDATEVCEEKESCDRCCSNGPGQTCKFTSTKIVWPSTPYQRTDENGRTYTGYTSATDGSAGSCGANSCGTASCRADNGNPNKFSGDHSRTKQAYLNALKAREEHIAYLQSCNLEKKYDLKSSSGYTADSSSLLYKKTTEGYAFEPKLTFSYDDEYDSLINIKSETILTDVDDVKYCVDCLSKTEELNLIKDLTATSKTKKINYWTCAGKGTSAKCTITNITVPTNTLAYIVARKRTNFYQATEFYADIKTGVISTDRKANSIALTTKNIFPLSLTKSNTSGTKKYEFTATYSSLGDKNSPKKKDQFKDGNYACKYEINNEWIPNCSDPRVCPNPGGTPTNGGYGFYYKQIRTDNVFPSGVKTGTWSTPQATALINDIETKNETVYMGVPRYEFIVSTSDIKNIKAYNRQKESEKTGYNDFDLTCTCVNGSGEEHCTCSSTFLKGLGSRGSLRNLVTSYKKDGVAQ